MNHRIPQLMIGHMRRHSQRHPRRGFTAVELLIATALSAMLVVSILGLLTTMNVHCRELIRRSKTEPWEQLLAEQLRRDLANARHVTVTSDQMVLSGYLGTQGLDHDNTLRAAEVTYHVASVGDTLCLLRDERRLDSLSNRVDSRQLVATGVASVQFVLPGTSKVDGKYSGPVPACCRIQFSGRSSTEPLAEVIWCQ